MDHKLVPPKATKGDLTHSVIKAAVASVPVIGGAGVEIFAAVVSAPLEKRRNEWMSLVGTALAELEKKVEGFSLERLSTDDRFLSLLLNASNSALKTHREEKIGALKNTILNAAVGLDIDEDVQSMLMSLIDDLTPTHLHVLAFFQNPRTAYAAAVGQNQAFGMGSPGQALLRSVPALQGRRDLTDQIVNELHARGLLSGPGSMLHTMMTGEGALSKRTTDLGDRFIVLISEPKQLKQK